MLRGAVGCGSSDADLTHPFSLLWTDGAKHRQLPHFSPSADLGSLQNMARHARLDTGPRTPFLPDDFEAHRPVGMSNCLMVAPELEEQHLAATWADELEFEERHAVRGICSMAPPLHVVRHTPDIPVLFADALGIHRPFLRMGLEILPRVPYGVTIMRPLTTQRPKCQAEHTHRPNTPSGGGSHHGADESARLTRALGRLAALRTFVGPAAGGTDSRGASSRDTVGVADASMLHSAIERHAGVYSRRSYADATAHPASGPEAAPRRVGTAAFLCNDCGALVATGNPESDGCLPSLASSARRRGPALVLTAWPRRRVASRTPLVRLGRCAYGPRRAGRRNASCCVCALARGWAGFHATGCAQCRARFGGAPAPLRTGDSSSPPLSPAVLDESSGNKSI